MNTISENPSYTDLLKQIDSLKSILNLLPVSGKEELKKNISTIEQQINALRFEQTNLINITLTWVGLHMKV